MGPVDGSPGPWDAFVFWYAPADVLALHDVERPDDFEAIKDSMRSVGWRGRPLLALREEGFPKLIAQTGSHRLAAAIAVGLQEIPVVVVMTSDDVDLNVDKVVPDIEMLLAYAKEDGPEFVDAVTQLWQSDYW